MTNVVLAANVFLKHEFLDQAKALNNLKKAIANTLFIETLQETFQQINDMVVGCVCDACTAWDSPNYPMRNSLIDWDDGIAFRRSSKGLTNRAPDGKMCLLYDWIAQLMNGGGDGNGGGAHDGKNASSPLPKLPEFTGQNLLDLLYKGEVSWISQLQAMEFRQQVKWLYPKIYELHLSLYGRNIPIAFEDWFVIGNERLSV